MKKWLLVAVLACALGGNALADVVTEPLAADNFAGYFTIDAVTGETAQSTGSRFVGDIYENVLAPAAANFGSSSTDLNTIWGDRVTAVGTGTVTEFALTVFNSSSSGNVSPITTMDVQITFLRDADSSLIGGFSGTINFGAGLNPGFFSIVTFTNLDTLATPIMTDTTALRLEQARLAHTGGSIRMGIASLVPINVGSSPDTMLINHVETTFASPANPGYRVNVIPEPGSLALLGLAAAAFRRR